MKQATWSEREKETVYESTMVREGKEGWKEYVILGKGTCSQRRRTRQGTSSERKRT